MRWPRFRRESHRDRDRDPDRPAATRRRARWAEPASPSVGGVHLAFTDGSELQLGAADPHAQALKAVADVLMERTRP